MVSAIMCIVYSIILFNLSSSHTHTSNRIYHILCYFRFGSLQIFIRKLWKHQKILTYIEDFCKITKSRAKVLKIDIYVVVVVVLEGRGDWGIDKLLIMYTKIFNDFNLNYVSAYY